MKQKLFALLLAVLLLGGCGAPAASPETTPPAAPAATEPAPALAGHSLQIFCGAGMKKPVTDIVEAFKTESGCEVALTFANAAQIQTQINTAQEGDLFIAGSAEELKPVGELVSEQLDLVKHIPVLAVQKGNPLAIAGLADLAHAEVRLLLGDASSTPIGKIGDKALKDAGIFDKVNLLARSTTAPALVTALAADECDAAIVWKENAGESVELVATTDLDSYVKTIPAASLRCGADDEARAAFLRFLGGDAAKEIWQNYGYEILN